MAQTAAADTEPWVKTVRGKTMLIPTVELVRIAALAAGELDLPALRRSLAEDFGTDSACPVTVRRHLKTLGLLARKAQ